MLQWQLPCWSVEQGISECPVGALPVSILASRGQAWCMSMVDICTLELFVAMPGVMQQAIGGVPGASPIANAAQPYNGCSSNSKMTKAARRFFMGTNIYQEREVEATISLPHHVVIAIFTLCWYLLVSELLL